MNNESSSENDVSACKEKERKRRWSCQEEGSTQQREKGNERKDSIDTRTTQHEERAEDNGRSRSIYNSFQDD